jgi:hypothetical protein
MQKDMHIVTRKPEDIYVVIQQSVNTLDIAT